MSAVKANSEAGKGNRFSEYLASLKYEWMKISWPERKQWLQSTAVVFVFTLILMGIITVFDLATSFVMRRLFGL